MAETAQKAELTLGGFPAVISGEMGWPLRAGVRPVVREFAMAPDDAKRLAERGRAVTLSIQPPEGNGLTVEKLYVINIGPGQNPWESSVRVADRRYWWSYPHVLRRHNIRRSVGTKRLIANDEFAVDFDRAPDVQFWTWSLDDGRRWTPLSAILDVFREISDAEKNAFGEPFRVTVDSEVGVKIKGLPYEGVEVDDPGDAALSRILAYLPGADVYVDYDGTVIVYSKTSGREREIVQALMPEIWNEGHTDLVLNNLIRPREIHVLFTRHVEVRFDFIEAASSRTTVAADSPSPLGLLRRMENVLPISDYQLSVAEVDSTNPLAQGNWITVDQAFRAWGNFPFFGETRPFDHDLAQMGFIPEMDWWTAFQIAGEAPDANDNATLKPWVGRIAEVQAHYRQTFRINTEFRDRMLKISEYRVATINPQTGQRAPSRAYGDYCVLYTQRSIWKNAAQGKPLDYAHNRSAFPTGGDLDSDAEPSPAVVLIVDNDQGIVRVEYSGRHPLTGDTRTILPSQIVGDSMPTANLRNRKRNITFDSVLDSNNPPRLSPSFRLAMILTCVPAAPNTDQQLHRIVVKPSEIADLLPAGARQGLGDAKGPVMEVRVGANMEVARVQWKDDRASDIEKCFGLSNGQETDELPDLTGLVINEGNATNLETGGSTNLIARAAAARIYAARVDRYEGSMTGYLNGQVRLAGWAEEIIHQYDTDAAVTTRVVFPDEVPRIPLAAFLDSSTRAAIFRLVKPEGA